MKRMIFPASADDFLQHRLQPLLELAAVLGARQQPRHVEHEDALALQRLGHLVVDDALREALDDGGLAHARLADQHRVVLGAPLQDLDRAADLVVAADHRVELALLGALGEVDRVLLQRLALAFGLGRVHALAAAHRVDRGLQRLLRQAVVARELAGDAFVVRHREQEHLARDVAVAPLLRFLVGGVQDSREVAADLHLAIAALHLGLALDGAVERAGERRHVDSRALQQRLGPGVVLPEHREQHVHGLDVLVVVADGDGLRVLQRFLELGRELVESHGWCAQWPFGWRVLWAGVGPFKPMKSSARPPASIAPCRHGVFRRIAGPPRTTSCSAAPSPPSPSSLLAWPLHAAAQDDQPGRCDGAGAAERAGQRRGRRPRPLHARPGRRRGRRGARTAARRTRGARGARHRGLLRSEAALRARRIRRHPLPADRRPRAADPRRSRWT